MSNCERLPEFKGCDELTELMKNFEAHCYVDCRTACLRKDKNGNLGSAERVKELYEVARSGSLDTISPFGISFTIQYDSSGNWMAFPNLPDRHPFKVKERLLFGTNHDWQEKLVGAVAKMCGIEPSDDVYQHMVMM